MPYCKSRRSLFLKEKLYSPSIGAVYQLGTGIGDREGSDLAEVTKWLITRVGAHRSRQIVQSSTSLSW